MMGSPECLSFSGAAQHRQNLLFMVGVLCWMDRVATKDALVARSDTSCVFCDAAIESVVMRFSPAPCLRCVDINLSLAGF
jgi:hypothetical protein